MNTDHDTQIKKYKCSFRLPTFAGPRRIVVMHGSILPATIPPGQLRGQVQPFGPGGGELFEAVLSREERGGANRK